MATSEDERSKINYQLTDIEHIKQKINMYLGGTTHVLRPEYIYKDGKIVTEEVKLSPAIYKVVDEAIVNTIDQYTRTSGKTEIYINFDKSKREISIRNTHSTVGVFLTKNISGKEMYFPELVFGNFRSGTNFGNVKKSGDAVTGGTFGFGIKLTNMLSEYFQVETYDSKSRMHYTQKWEDHMDRVYPPKIETRESKNEYVEIKFKLSDAKLSIDDEIFDNLEKIVYMRAIQSNVFTNNQVFWNADKLPIKTLGELSKAFSQDEFIDVKLCNSKYPNYPWNIVVSCKDENDGFESMSIVNGLSLKTGSHISYLSNQICDYCRDKYLEFRRVNKFQKNSILKYILLLMQGYIENVEPTGQRKDEITVDKNKIEGYKFSKSDLEKIWQMVLTKMTKDSKPKKTKINRNVKAKKYNPAINTGPKYTDSSILFIVEGDSAFGVIDQARSLGIRGLSSENCGIFSIQGVPPNFRKDVTNYKKYGDYNVAVPPKNVLNNERINALINIIGLTWDNPDPDIDNLNYGKACIITDADKDGLGNIRSQILNDMMLFWPGLVSKGFFYKIDTPQVRAYPKNSRSSRVMEFQFEEDFEKWKSENQGFKRDWDVSFYKGIGQNSPEEIEAMFRSHWPQMMKQYTVDGKTPKAFEAYFGKDTGVRKVILSTAPLATEYAYMQNDKISLTDHLNTSTKEFQQFNIARHIPHYCDQMLPVRRKIVYGSRKYVNSHGNKKTKIVEYSGYITTSAEYHQGDASLNKALTGCSQSFLGARRFPYFKALSSMGTRKFGGRDAVQPRYSGIKLNDIYIDTMFPVQDDCLLDYTIGDKGVAVEPEFYIPILPIAILEDFSAPGTGWSCKVYGRDYFQVSGFVKKLIQDPSYKLVSPLGGKNEFVDDFDINDYGYKHELVRIKGVLNSVGKYTYDSRKNCINITEMPMKMSNDVFIFGKSKKPDEKDEKKDASKKAIIDDPLIKNIYDLTKYNEVNIRIDLKPGAYEEIVKAGANDSGLDPVIKYFNLKQSLKSNINFVSDKDVPITFNKYVDVLYTWFEVRKKYYEIRVKRITVLLQLKIIMLENQIRFVHERQKLDISDVPESQQISILSKNKYTLINHTLLNDPKLTKVDDIEYLVLKSEDASYDYLLIMNSKDLSKEGLQRFEKKLEKYRRELEDMKNDPKGTKMWISEIEKLDDVVKSAFDKGWNFDEPKYKF